MTTISLLQEPNLMVGKYFHSFESGALEWQGVIVGRPRPGIYLVQLFEWILGAASDQMLVPIENMKAWKFYDTATDMRAAYAAYDQRHPLRTRQ